MPCSDVSAIADTFKEHRHSPEADPTNVQLKTPKATMTSLPTFPPGGNMSSGATTAPYAVQSPLIVLIENNRLEISAADLRDEMSTAALRERIQSSPGMVAFVLSQLLEWTDDDRWAVLDFVVGLSNTCDVRATETGPAEGNLFDVILSLMVGHEEVIRCERGRMAAVEAAALVYPDALPPACNRIQGRLRELRVSGFRVGSLLVEARAIVEIRATPSPSDSPLMPVINCLQDAPVPEEVVVLTGWLFSAAGVGRLDGRADADVVISSPIVITRRLIDIRDNTEAVELAWQRDGQWRTRVVDRSQIANHRQIVQLANFGVPVTSNNEKHVVQYLADFEAYNIEILPRSEVTKQLGWLREDGQIGFLWGREFIGLSDDNPVIFKGADTGQEQLVDGFGRRGTIQCWSSAIAPIEHYPRVQLALYAAFCACLLRILRAPNFVLSYAGATSTGKTTACRVAGSVWGNPDEECPEAVIGTWDATRVWAEHNRQRPAVHTGRHTKSET